LAAAESGKSLRKDLAVRKLPADKAPESAAPVCVLPLLALPSLEAVSCTTIRMPRALLKITR
jgi:hypothetical protein